MNNQNWLEYLNKDVVCGCGRIHRCEIDDIIIEDGALNRITEILERYPYKKLCVVSDIHTHKVAGKKVCDLLLNTKYEVTTIIFDQEELIPDEAMIGSLLIDLPKDCELILAVGAGTINDLCKFVSWKLDIPYFILGTAPSMDGYASNVAPLIVKNLKTTYEVGMPKVILGDLDILCQAPLAMIAAGAGDILGKYVCLTDWMAAHLITGEYYCEYVESLVRESIEAVVSAIPRVKSRAPEAIKSIMEGLVLSGIAMSYIGNSRPASGSEHHLSHYWEMMSLFKGSHGRLHGTKVGVGTVLGIMMYEKLANYLETENLDQEIPPFNQRQWSDQIKVAYQQAAPQVLELENRVHKNSNESVSKRKIQLKAKKTEFMQLISKLPKAETVICLLKEMDAPYLPSQIQVDSPTLKNSILYAKEIRNRFGLLQILYDLNLQENWSDWILEVLSSTL